MSKLKLTTWPSETVEAIEAPRDRPTPGRVECPRCTKTFLASAVVIDEPLDLPTSGGPIPTGRCRLYCDHCDVVVQWRAEILDGAVLTRNVFGSHAIIYDRRIVRALLAAHPHAAGIAQS